jgi:hypothetical protein
MSTQPDDPLYTTISVVLPDGSIGTCLASELSADRHRTDVSVVHRDRIIGRGPWIFDRSQVREATPEEAADYLAACAAVTWPQWPLPR